MNLHLKSLHRLIRLMVILLFTIFTIITHTQNLPENVEQKNIQQDLEYIMGGTIGRYETQLGIFIVTENKPLLVTVLKCKTNIITDFTDYLEYILNELKSQGNIVITRACFGVPGNTLDRLFIQAPHLSFPVDGNQILERGLLQQIFVMNDFEVQGYGIDSIDQKNIIEINKGTPREHAPRALVGAGAGLGSVLLTWDVLHQRYQSLPLGACFMDFAPQTTLELDFANYIRTIMTKQSNVSWGYVLGSGSGIVGVYNYLNNKPHYTVCNVMKDAETIFTERFDTPLYQKSVDFYLQLYARLIRNMAYAVLPYGGLYITNTIATNHSSLLTDKIFVDEIFTCHNDWLKNMLSDIPMYVVTDDALSLYGAANYLLLAENQIKKQIEDTYSSECDSRNL